MRARFLVGAAALLGAVTISGTAHAGCSDYLNEARRSETTDARLHDLLRLATGCQPRVLDGIQTQIELRAGVSEEPKPEDETTAVVLDSPVRPPPPPVRTQSFRPLTIGAAARSSLTPTGSIDPENNVAYELWQFHVANPERLQVAMTAADGANLDTYLIVGQMRNGQFEEIARNDDRGDGTLNSMLRFTPESSGDYVVRARSFWQDQYGPYELIVQPTASLPTAQAIPQPLTLGELHEGRLGPDSAIDTADGGYSYELWTFNAVAGQRLDVSMASSNVDTYVVVGRMRGGRFQEIASNDDRYDGSLSSMLRFVPEESGEYVIRARSFTSEQWGPYELLVQPTPPVGTPVAIARAANAWAYQGEISPEEGSPRYVDFAFDATRGRHYSVRARSGEFTPIVDVGLLQSDGALTEVDFFGASERDANTADIPAAVRGRYILRVSAPALANGSFDLIVGEVR